jgi:hypothetical protein
MSTWSTTDKTANITTSGGALTATTTSAAEAGIRGTLSRGSGKWYLEFRCGTETSGIFGVGFASSSWVLTDANDIGGDAAGNSVGIYDNGQVFIKNAIIGSSASLAFGSTNTIGAALDLDNLKIWYENLTIGLGWNGDILANQDPANNIGGYPLSTLATGPFFFAFGDAASGNAVTINPSSGFTGTVPTNFLAWDTIIAQIPYNPWPLWAPLLAQ